MDAPKFDSVTDIKARLSSDQILWIGTADPRTGVVAGAAPDWLIELCHDHGLVTPGEKRRTWKLSPVGQQLWGVLNQRTVKQAGSGTRVAGPYLGRIP